MRVGVYEVDGEPTLYVHDGDAAASLGTVDLVELLRDGTAAQRIADAAAGATPGGGPPQGARRLAPLRRPGKQVFVGVNYHDHVDELPPPWTMTADPFLFAKLPSAIIGPGEAIVIPGPENKVDYEVELLVVIGRRAKHLTEADALDHVFGYTIVNDVTERVIQATDSQLIWGKGFDTFCPMGPDIVLTDEIPDPAGLGIWTTVNGEERQRSSTDNFIFSIPDILARITRHITLEPGDTVSTGTPAGVGYVKDPPVFLAPGDTVTVGVDRIGELTNTVRAGWED
ncbi:fumarylacetoacetate hydrolase family protein [Baekduia soli]|uniref:Fumarylacetoacetate hydrolase family protein n=1 Tax=Baekduia soli TaxID=496014 RepID=A0A5B8UA17_9ACTN|nr:fumarylacetoacetate hydrolase family protein [Baekduia soli]QEC49512.1 fumarylacetoacetate hydrolase family protein [Baekduia soli]